MTRLAAPLRVYAGEHALAHIQEFGLRPADISMLLGASSGPKWLVLQAIDEYLIGEFFKGRTQNLSLLGTSAGAWRMASYAIGTGLDAHQRLTESYIEQRYSEKPDGQEILNTCRAIIRLLLGEHGAQDIIEHPCLRMNLITAQCHGLTRARHKFVQSLGFGSAAILNSISRKTLAWQFTRVVMHHPEMLWESEPFTDLPTRYAPLSPINMENAILSTGSIPIIIKGVENVAGAGIYQDGGITDYGFDLPLLPPLLPDQGYVLYPHFNKIPAPGWFDKNLSWRRPAHQNYAKTIMLVPSDEFISRLPYGKIPDRHDFLNFSDQERIRYWRKTLALSQYLAEDLSDMNWQTRVEPLPW